jgi:phosphocarrier protein HPr
MQQCEYIVQDKMGLHARSVGLIARLALLYQESKITISCRGKTSLVTHLTAVMAMLIMQGDTIVISVNGGEEEKIVDEILKTLQTKKV